MRAFVVRSHPQNTPVSRPATKNVGLVSTKQLIGAFSYWVALQTSWPFCSDQAFSCESREPEKRKLSLLMVACWNDVITSLWASLHKISLLCVIILIPN